jgi:hypothetical protein
MRLPLLITLCVCLTGCVKTDLQPFSHVTRVDVRGYRWRYQNLRPSLTDREEVSAIVNFINRQRSAWTRTFVFEFGMPQPLVRADLYDGNTYLGYFAVGGGRLPGSHGVFEVRCGKILARKRVTMSEANQFVDLIGVRGVTLLE